MTALVRKSNITWNILDEIAPTLINNKLLTRHTQYSKKGRLQILYETTEIGRGIIHDYDKITELIR